MKTQFQDQNPGEKALWAKAFPEEFPFYHLGQVQIEKSAPATAIGELALAGYFPLCFSFHGDLRGLMILLLDRDLDMSVYGELGNILASTIANELSVQNELDVMISPPYSLSIQRLKETVQDSETKIIRRVYQHLHDKVSVRVEALIIPSEAQNEVGHA